ncbi:MAG: Trk system potassium transporter TrkA [Clostridia bacterium]|nr:Trk system potassium transporter TrkA [Clostridia bacterium]
MDIIITGLGSVGITLVKELTEEGHNVVVVDRNAQKVEETVNNFDVKGVVGNGASNEILFEAGVSSADLLIAATNRDEMNILCCIIAHRLGVKKTIARTSQADYANLFSDDSELGLNLMVNPQQEAAKEISRMLRFPSAIKVDQFSEGKVELIEFRVASGSKLEGLVLKNLKDTFKSKVLICAAQRNGKAIIPDGNFVIRADDRLFLTATTKNISAFFKELGWNRQAKNVIIVGGSTTARYLCREIAKVGISTKLIEKDEKRAAFLCEDLSHTEVIIGDGTDQSLLVDEGIDSADAFVALGNIDEQNIMMSMYAISREVPKVITKIDQLSYHSMLQKSGIYSVVSTKTSAADQIVRFVRLMGNKKGSGVKRLFHIIDETTEILEFEAGKNFRRFDVPLQDLRVNLKDDLLIAGIIRNEELITPSGQDVIKEGDSVIVVTLEEGFDNLNDILNF